MSAVANYFVGQDRSPLLVVKPYISRMTESELFAIMVGGTASIAGSCYGWLCRNGRSFNLSYCGLYGCTSCYYLLN